MYVSGLTDVGFVRNQNQDAIFFSSAPIGPLPNLYIVADGMGGHNAGDVASNQAIKHFSEYIRNFPAAQFVQSSDYLDLMVNAAQIANVAVFEQAEAVSAMAGMGTTLTACVLSEEKAMIVQVGDSRAYAISPERIEQITTDHTYIQELLQAGRISREEASTHPKRHVLTRALGTQSHLEVDGIVREIGEWEAVLLCSDGLNNMLDDETIMEIVNREGYVEHRVRALIDRANEQGGRDNISVVLIDIKR